MEGIPGSAGQRLERSYVIGWQPDARVGGEIGERREEEERADHQRERQAIVRTRRYVFLVSGAAIVFII